MSECSLVHEPCRRPGKIGGLAQVLQRRTSTWGDRPTDADYVAESRWRSQPATVKEAGKLYLPAIQSSASLQTGTDSPYKRGQVGEQVNRSCDRRPAYKRCAVRVQS